MLNHPRFCGSEDCPLQVADIGGNCLKAGCGAWVCTPDTPWDFDEDLNEGSIHPYAVVIEDPNVREWPTPGILTMRCPICGKEFPVLAAAIRREP